MSGQAANFIWYELITPEPDAAARFYHAVAGWEASRSAPGAVDYRLLAMPGQPPIAGILPTPAQAEGMPPVWLAYVGVADVDAMTAEAVAVGAAVHMPPTDIPGVGRFAFLADPQGARFYVMRGTGEAPPLQPDAAGHFAWNELATPDQDAALAFYGRLFGWTQDGAMPMGAMGDYRFLGSNGRAIGATMSSTLTGAPTGWSFYVNVPDIDAAVATIGANGGRVLDGPHEIPGGDFSLKAIDAQGAAIGFVGPRVA